DPLVTGVQTCALPISELYGFECLTRGPRGTNFESPDVLFDYVRLKRQEIVVDRACIAAGLRNLPHLDGQVRISINVHASTLGRRSEEHTSELQSRVDL